MRDGKRRILLIDDDRDLGALLKQYLNPFGFELLTLLSPVTALETLAAEKPDLILLDIMLPQITGIALLQEIRKKNKVPVIMLTARGEPADRVVGLELGADDYVPKPFEPRELVARMEAVLRRGEGTRGEKSTQGTVLRSDDLVVDQERRTVKMGSSEIELSTAEFELLVYLMTRAGVPRDRDQILDDLKGVEWEAYNRSIDVTISRLRQKLGDDPKHPRFIKTVWGKGYVFVGDLV